MIKVNLLPVKADRQAETLKIQGAIAAVAILVTLGVCWSFLSGIKQEVERTKQEITSTQAEIRKLRDIIGEIDQIKQRKENLERQLAVIESLEESRFDTVRMMEAVANTVPEQLWLNSLTYSGNGVSVNGHALDNQIIAEFIQNLNRHKQVTGVVLGETSRVDRGGLSIVRFSMRFTVRPERPERG